MYETGEWPPGSHHHWTVCWKIGPLVAKTRQLHVGMYVQQVHAPYTSVNWQLQKSHAIFTLVSVGGHSPSSALACTHLGGGMCSCIGFPCSVGLLYCTCTTHSSAVALHEMPRTSPTTSNAARSLLLSGAFPAPNPDWLALK